MREVIVADVNVLRHRISNGARGIYVREKRIPIHWSKRNYGGAIPYFCCPTCDSTRNQLFMDDKTDGFVCKDCRRKIRTVTVEEAMARAEKWLNSPEGRAASESLEKSMREMAEQMAAFFRANKGRVELRVDPFK